MQKKLSKQNNSGFTLSEVLIAVAILIVLMGLAMIPITRHQRDLRQTELDAKAEIVYHAAQNKLSELLANGRISDCYAEDLQPLNNTPLDAAERKTSLHYVTSAAKTGEGSAAAAILPKDQVDRQLWDNHWVIELDPASGSVYAVFYSEKPLTYDFDSFNPLRFRDGRLSAGATVGYYGGDSVQSEITGKLTPHMEIINKEQLLLRVTCDTPMEPLHFYVTVSDGVHSTSRIELTGSEVKTDYLTYTATMVLDSLTDGMRFGQQARFKNKNLTPGADLTITVEVTCENRLVDSASGTLTANSLFAEVRGGDTAVVTYARHLQNLDTASRLPDSITRAVQEQDIQFVNENTDDGWDRLYGSRTFTPITNSRLTYCESKATVNGQVYHPVIYGLTVNTTGDGGLFAAFSGTLKNLRLCGADITASGATGPENYATSYALGGLVGIAYDYDENLKDKTKVSTISNCAIAGYTVTDNSKNRQFLGEAAIGGLVGVSSANLNRCSAVVKLNINCTHRYANTGAMNKAQWGNYVRVGGLVGGVRYDVSDCYTGGSITVANDLLNERIPTGNSTNTAFVDRYESTPKAVKMTQGGAEAGPDTYVYIGGIGGSGFSATFSNFSGSKDGQPTYNNCYTYMTFPAMEGTITGISLIGSIADRAGVNGGTAQLTINNCYYLDSSAAISFGNLPTFYSKSIQSNGQYTYYSLATLLSTDTARMDMLRGDLSYLSKYTWNTGSSPYTINGLRALSYEQMSGRADIDGKSFTALLNGGSDDGSFHWVTTEENGQSAHGKYSFPGSAAALLGQDYPFPTVLTQGTACLHYGEWPTRGLYWSSGVLSLDRITTPSVTLSLHFTQDTDADAVPVITCSREGIVAVSVPQAQTPPADVRHSYTVTLTGLKVGSTEVFATLDGYTARLLVSVTSTLDISVDGLPGDDFFVGDTCNLRLTARDSRGSALDVKWTVTPQYGGRVLTASVPVTNADRTASVTTLTAAGEGEDRTLITAAYTAPGGETFTSQLPLVLPVRMQGVLGIANTSVPETPAYKQGIMTHAGDAFLADTSAPLYNGAPYTAAPAYTGAPVYLYGQGSAADLTAANEDGSYRFTLSAAAVTVGAGTDAVTYDALSGTADYRIIEGQPQSLTDTLFTVRPLTVKGKQAGNVTLTVTLMDTEGHAFTLSIPYTLTEEDTRVTATLRVDEQALTLSVPYGTAPAAEALSQLLTDNGISPDTIDSWTPDITQPLYADTAFTAVRKTTDSGGAPTVPDADIPASGSKDPEGTPSDDPSAPDSSSSGTDPTPEPSPDTLP